jgi:hypothetical protein
MREVAGILGMDASLWPEGVGLRLGALEWKDTGAAAQVLLELSQESRDEPLFAQALASAASTAVNHPSAEWVPETLLEIADGVAEQAPLGGARPGGGAAPALERGRGPAPADLA